jgi:hypothetical protein
MSNVKNYTEQGGEKTVIGGMLEIAEGGKVVGLPSAVNQVPSTASSVAEITDDFNNLLKKLKDALIMTPDEWNVSVAKIPTPSGEDLTANQGKVTAITIEEGVITVAVPVSELIPFDSSNPAQGTHKWVGMAITTGLADITQINYNGYQLTQGDVSEAAAFGCSAGDIIMWLKCDEIVNTPKTFTLWSSGYLETTFTVVISEPDEE